MFFLTVPSIKLVPKVYSARWQDISLLAEREARSDREDVYSTLLAPGDSGNGTLFSQPVCTEKFSHYLRNPDKGLLMVVWLHKDLPESVNEQEVLAGYLAMKSFDKQNYIESLHIWKEYRRNGYGRFLLNKSINLPERFSQYKRKVTTISVRESSLGEQLFLKSCGFRCEKILKDFYDLPVETAYIFRHRIN